MKVDGNISAAGHMQILSQGEIVPVMTLRDYFAAAALQGLITHNVVYEQATLAETAFMAYSHADAMIAARGNEGGE